jgi:ElaB/YqjD/DUF883 family membrane-anchored ribosome-binding protein
MELVDNIQKLIDDVENVFTAEARVSKEADLCGQEAKEVRDEKALPELRDIALKQDTRLAEAIAKLVHNVRIWDEVACHRGRHNCRTLRNRPLSRTICMTNPKLSTKRRFRTSLVVRPSPFASQ